MTFGNAESETGRLEAFSDGVLAVIITIMAFGLRAPAGGSFTDLRGRLPARPECASSARSWLLPSTFAVSYPC